MSCLDRPADKTPEITKGSDGALTFTIRDDEQRLVDISGAVAIVLKVRNQDASVVSLAGTLVSGPNGKISVPYTRVQSALFEASVIDSCTKELILCDLELVYEIGAVRTIKNLPQSVRILNAQFP